jgi:hypothetical protein
MNPTSVYLGTALLASGFCGEQWWSSVMLCKKCGETWGRIARPNSEWSAFHAPCPKHGGGSFLPELLWGGSSGCIATREKQGDKFLKANPLLLRYEFQLAMRRNDS